VSRGPDGFVLSTDSGDEYECRALILATGASPVKLGIPGEADLSGKGVSYCAVCDGPFYQDQEVAVVGGGDSAVEEAAYLTRFAKKVHIIHRRDELRAVKEIQEKAFNEPKVIIHWSYIPVAVLGEHGVEALRIRSVKEGSEEDLPVYGVFFYVGLNPNLLEGTSDLVETDARNFIITDADMACRTPGLFAAGDVRAKSLRQIATAVGDGAVAAFSAQHYLESL
jgi:thioredoxin reductase (NADPH)